MPTIYFLSFKGQQLCQLYPFNILHVPLTLMHYVYYSVQINSTKTKFELNRVRTGQADNFDFHLSNTTVL